MCPPRRRRGSYPRPGTSVPLSVATTTATRTTSSTPATLRCYVSSMAMSPTRSSKDASRQCSPPWAKMPPSSPPTPSASAGPLPCSRPEPPRQQSSKLADGYRPTCHSCMPTLPTRASSSSTTECCPLQHSRLIAATTSSGGSRRPAPLPAEVGVPLPTSTVRLRTRSAKPGSLSLSLSHLLVTIG